MTMMKSDVDDLNSPLLPAGAMLLFLRAMGTFLGDCVEACDMEEMVLAVSAMRDGDRKDDTGEAIDCVANDGDLSGCTGCMGSWSGCAGGKGCCACTCACACCVCCCCWACC